MFRNVGNKIKTFAKVVFAICVIASVVAFIITIVIDQKTDGELSANLVGLAFLFLGGGVLSSWIITLFIYGFGELVHNSSRIAEVLETK